MRLSPHRERCSPYIGAATTEAHSPVESQYAFELNWENRQTMMQMLLPLNS